MSPGKRTLDIDPPGARRLDCRSQDMLLFGPDHASFAGMGIESCQRQARSRNPKQRQLPRREIDDPAEPLRCQHPRHVRQRNMHGGKNNLERRGPEHHRDLACAGEMREQVRVSLPLQAGL